MTFVPHKKHIYGPLWPVTWIFFQLPILFASCTHIRTFSNVTWIDLLFLYVDDVRTSQKTHIRVSTACYRDSFVFVHVDDVRTSQETYQWA
jgi:hypothetical protein